MQRDNNNLQSASTTPVQLIGMLALCYILLFSLSCSKHKVSYLSSSTQVSSKPVNQNSAKTALKSFYNDWKGVSYKTGGMSHSGIDCSGLTVLAYKDIFATQLPRTTKEQARLGKKVSKKTLQPGDLVFFKTGVFQRHVGIVLEEDRFIHASTSKGVMISRLNNPYWQDAYWKASRLNTYR